MTERNTKVLLLGASAAVLAATRAFREFGYCVERVQERQRGREVDSIIFDELCPKEFDQVKPEDLQPLQPLDTPASHKIPGKRKGKGRHKNKPWMK